MHKTVRPREKKELLRAIRAGKESTETSRSGLWTQTQCLVRSFTFSNPPGLSQNLLSDRTLLPQSRAHDLHRYLFDTEKKTSKLGDKFNEHLLYVMLCEDQKTLLGLFGIK